MITQPDLRAEVLSALSTAGAYCGECGFEPGETGCPDCRVVRGMYADAVMPIIERLCAEPLVARWSKGVTHHDAGTTVECVDADDTLRGIALELDPDDREALGLMLVDPDGEMDQADDLLSEVRTVSVTAPADAEELRNGFGEYSITPKWVCIEYRWCDPSIHGTGAFQAGRSRVGVVGPIVGDADGGDETVTFRTRTDDRRPDWVKRLVAKHNPPGWPLADSRAASARQADEG